MIPLAKNALSRLPVQSIQQVMARQIHQKRIPDFHDKYGNNVLASGATLCVATWTYTATQIGTEWNLSLLAVSHPKGMETSVIIPAGVIMNCLKTNS